MLTADPITKVSSHLKSSSFRTTVLTAYSNCSLKILGPCTVLF